MLILAKKKATPSGFGERLKAVRESRDLTQAELCERMGMNQSVLSRYERGDRLPAWNVIEAFCEALGCEPNDFWEARPGVLGE